VGFGRDRRVGVRAAGPARWSTIDGGASYKDVKSWAGGCGYSEMTLLNESSVQHNDTSHEGPTISLFYEGGSATTDYSDQMSFVRLDSAALLRAYLGSLKTSYRTPDLDLDLDLDSLS
jgi:hypothetical protein